MLDHDVCELCDLPEADLRTLLENDGEGLRFRLKVDNLYQSPHPPELTTNWLRVWYVGERIAQHCRHATVYFREVGNHGEGNVVFTLKSLDAGSLARTFSELLPAFDPNDDGEADLCLLDSATDWLETLDRSKVRFSDLQEAYEGDAATAREWEERYSDDAAEDDS